MITPFDENEEVDGGALREHTDWLISQGAHALFPNSCTGEAPKLTVDEKKRVMDIVIDQAKGEVPVIPGVGDIATKRTIELMRYAKDAGANAGVVMVPFYWKYPSEIILDHYRTITDKVDLPIVLYDNPETNNPFSPELISRILKETSNVIAIKDSSFDMVRLNKEIQMFGDKIAVIQGIEQLLLPSLVMGAAGGIPGIGNVCAHFMVDMYNNFVNGRMKEAVQMQTKLLMLWNATETYGYESFIKEAVAQLGHPVGQPRAPSRYLDTNEKAQVRQILIEFGLLE
jgi:4-hydroxy-tetrahydrodipicolinate synthase